MTIRMKLFITIITLTLAACGGGSSGDGGSAPAPAVPSSKTTAVLKIGTQGALGAGVSIFGVGVIVTLPTGVTVATDSSGNVAASAAVVSGVATGGGMAAPVYTPATATAKATRKLIVAAAGSGFGTGEFVTVPAICRQGTACSQATSRRRF
jgi:hypothetical protein